MITENTYWGFYCIKLQDIRGESRRWHLMLATHTMWRLTTHFFSTFLKRERNHLSGHKKPPPSPIQNTDDGSWIGLGP